MVGFDERRPDTNAHLQITGFLDENKAFEQDQDYSMKINLAASQMSDKDVGRNVDADVDQETTDSNAARPASLVVRSTDLV